MTSVVSVRIYRHQPSGLWSWSARDVNGQVVHDALLPTMHPSKQHVMQDASDAYPNAEMVEVAE